MSISQRNFAWSSAGAASAGIVLLHRLNRLRNGSAVQSLLTFALRA